MSLQIKTPESLTRLQDAMAITDSKTLRGVTVTSPRKKERGRFFDGLGKLSKIVSQTKIPTVTMDMNHKVEESKTSWALIAVIGLIAFSMLGGKKLLK
jgi:hypothetical protein